MKAGGLDSVGPVVSMQMARELRKARAVVYGVWGMDMGDLRPQKLGFRSFWRKKKLIQITTNTTTNYN